LNFYETDHKFETATATRTVLTTTGRK